MVSKFFNYTVNDIKKNIVSRDTWGDYFVIDNFLNASVFEELCKDFNHLKTEDKIIWTGKEHPKVWRSDEPKGFNSIIGGGGTGRKEYWVLSDLSKVWREFIEVIYSEESIIYFLDIFSDTKSFKDNILIKDVLHSSVGTKLSSQFNNFGWFIHPDGTQKLISAEFNPLSGKVKTISGGKTQILITLKEPVTVDTSSGVPFIDVNNNQLGGGSASTARYTFYESTGLQMRFEFDLTASPNNSGTVAANVIAAGISLVGAITNSTLNAGTGGVDSDNVGFTAAQGTGGAGFQDIVADVTINAGASNLTKIDFKVSASAATYSPGQTLTATATDIGFGGTGAVIVTIDSTVLTTDTLSMAGTAVDLNGATVINSGDGETTDLTYTSTSTNGSIPD